MRETTGESDRSSSSSSAEPGKSTVPVSPRLRFRGWSLSDAVPLLEICSDPSVMRFVGDGTVWSPEQVEWFVEQSIGEQTRLGWCRWALVDRSNDRLVGFCGFVATDDGPEVGWRLAADWWGRGLATEAGQAALKFGFERLGFQRVTATIQADNQASIRVARKLGMQQEHCIERDRRQVLVFAARPGSATADSAST